MVIKGASRRNIGFWSGHLKDTKKNDRAEMIEKRGLAAEDLRGMMREMLEGASGTRCQNFMYIASFNPCEGEILTEQQWERAFEIFEKQRGIPEGQARVVYEHEKKGRTHRHVVWDRIDTENMRAFPDSLDWKICQFASLQISQELGIQRPTGILDREPGTPRPERRPESWEMFRGQKSGLDPRDIKTEVTTIFRESAGPADFIAGLEANGYQLCQGDRRGFVVLDNAGDTHSLARRLDGINAKQLNAFMEGIDRATLPNVSQAKEKYQERKLAGLEADRATVRKEIEWEEALAKSAIEKEAIERRFAEPIERGTQPPPQVVKEPERPQEIVRGSAIDIRFAYMSTADPQAFVASLAERGIVLAVANKQEAEESRKQAEAARAEGRSPNATGFKEHETVAVDQRGHVHRLSERITGSSFGDMQRYLRTLDRGNLSGIEDARDYMRFRAEEDRSRKDRDRTANRLLGLSNIFDAGDGDDRHLKETTLDRVERRTIENERAAERPRNTRDR